jgi:hypothetical protein
MKSCQGVAVSEPQIRRLAQINKLCGGGSLM